MSARCDRYYGIDYSGASLPDKRVPGIRVFAASARGEAVEIRAGESGQSSWSRDALREWLVTELTAGPPTLVGIDHAFSLPRTKLKVAGVRSWVGLLGHFLRVVRTHERTVEMARRDRRCRRLLETAPGAPLQQRYRWIDRRTPGAKSVYHYIGPGVAHSTMAGIAQLALLRRELARRRALICFWPFDPLPDKPGASMVVEAYPALCNRQYVRLPEYSGDQHDARCLALWLRDCDCDGRLELYLRPPWSARDLSEVRMEGWILGVM